MFDGRADNPELLLRAEIRSLRQPRPQGSADPLSDGSTLSAGGLPQTTILIFFEQHLKPMTHADEYVGGFMMSQRAGGRTCAPLRAVAGF